ncbi:PQ-loop repeat-containing protein 3 [Acipenser ruthenus]|uniref:PQ-loop repeat-containing protein 3 n=1 Tax=Acipenser ruthenus TaxID=7906 RepID=A0A444U383_ACIRT|nr:PQ-loop repeat-containing protein 3 [Acipenser ruthenus]
MSADLVLHFANFSTLFVCLVLKFPQVFALVSAKSSRGISLKSLLLELTGGGQMCHDSGTTNLAYDIRQDHLGVLLAEGNSNPSEQVKANTSISGQQTITSMRKANYPAN